MRQAHAQRSLPTICDLPVPAAPLVPSGSPSVVPLTIFGSRLLHPFFPRCKCLRLSCQGFLHSQILTLSPDPSPFSDKPNFRDWARPASFPSSTRSRGNVLSIIWCVLNPFVVTLGRAYVRRVLSPQSHFVASGPAARPLLDHYRAFPSTITNYCVARCC